MKILLVELTRRSRLFSSPLWMPVYLPSVAAVLREVGHDVRLVEMGRLTGGGLPESRRLPEIFQQAVSECQPQVVLFDLQAEMLSDFRDLGWEARRAAPGAMILAGGRQATLLPEETLEEHPFLDGAVLGEPEETMLEIAGGAAPGKAAASAGREAGMIIRGPSRPPIADLDRLPRPAWDLLDMAYHTSRTPRVIPCLPLRTATVQSSRGCAGGCSFCAEGRIYSQPHRYHSAGYTVSLIRELADGWGIQGIYFSDETFLADRERVKDLCSEISRSGLGTRIRWSAQVRTDGLDPDILERLRRAGCVQLEFGVESGSQDMLDALGKGTTIEGNMEALRMTRRAGIRSLAYVMYALPGETADDLRRTRMFIREADPDIVRLVRFIPIPGTPATKALIAKGSLAHRFWEGQARRGDPFGGLPPNLTSLSDAKLARTARSLYFRCVFPRYVRDCVRHGLPTLAADVRPLELARLQLKKTLGRA